MRIRVIAAFSLFCATIAICLVSHSGVSRAQYDRPTQPRGAPDTVFREGHQSGAKKSWENLSAPMQECMARALSMRSTSIKSLAREGVGAGEALTFVDMSRCRALMSRELRQDFDCTIVQSDGISINTRCDEEYSESTGSFLRAISRDQYIFDGLRGERVSITQLETHAAMKARVDREAKVAAVECRKHEAEAFAVARRLAAAYKKPEAADAAFGRSLYAMLAEHPYCRYAQVYLKALAPRRTALMRDATADRN